MQSPAILPNAGVWATHMGVSSNLRYQLLNGLDMVSSTFKFVLLSCFCAKIAAWHATCHLVSKRHSADVGSAATAALFEDSRALPAGLAGHPLVTSRTLHARDSDLWTCASGSHLRNPNAMQVVQPRLPVGVFKVGSTGIRLLNNILGGMSFVTLAKFFKVQKASEEEATALPPCCNGAK